MTRRAAAAAFAALASFALVACKEEAPSVAPPDAKGAPVSVPGGEKAPKTIPASKDYPLKTCVVSDEDLPAVEKRVAIEVEGREVQFCCEHCVEDFLKDPKPALAKLDAAKK